MSELSWQRPGWRGWPWVRRALFLLPLSAVVWMAWASFRDAPIDATRVVVLAALTCWLAVGRQPRRAVAAYLVVLVVSLVLFPGNGLMWGDFPAWFLTAFVVLDANSRSPMWFGLLATVIAFLARTPMLGSDLSWDISDTVSIAFALILATLLGQLIRGAFAAGRASEDAAEARRLVERLELRHAVHDSGSARLAQLMLLTRAPRGSTSSTPRRRCRVWTARWSARPCAWFARRPPTSASTGPRAGASSRPRASAPTP
ncbi:MAG TPA: hypothetical protein PKY27_02565 [Arachnia sp.]|nr:hypothetical protein [Arachnia sp.]